MAVASVEQIRACFPALERVHRGRPVAYFDGPGGTQVPRAVTDAMTDYLHRHNANTHWAYPSSAETDAAIAHARGVFAAFLACAPEEIVFGANMTTLTLHASRALARSFPPGAEVVVTELDHHANVDPWRELEKDFDVVVRTARVDPATGTLDEAHLAEQIGARTALLAIGAASNALGTVNDVRRWADAAHAVGALVFVDGVHAAPHRLPDVSALGADLFACSPYKFHGPHAGVLFGRRELLDALDPPRLVPAGQRAPERFETGTLGHEAIVGSAAAVEWLASLAGDDGPLRERLAATYATLEERGAGLVERLWHGLADIDGVTLYGPPPGTPRTDTLAFTLDGASSRDVCAALAHEALFLSHGDFYATTLVERLGLASDGLVRAGCAVSTTADEIERLLAAVRARRG